MQDSLPKTGYVRLTGIIGNRKTGVPPLIPVSRSSWWNGITEGRYPKGVKLVDIPPHEQPLFRRMGSHYSGSCEASFLNSDSESWEAS